jgi:hypothetical protein
MTGKLAERVMTLSTRELQAFIERRIRRDAETRARMLVAMTEALEERLGAEEGFEAARQVHQRLTEERRLAPPAADEDRGVQAFCTALETGCTGTHEWERVEDAPDRVAYRFTQCAWAELFRELSRPDIGHWFCDGDAPAARAFNPRIGFHRTRVLMDGDPCCDHVFFLERDRGQR